MLKVMSVGRFDVHGIAEVSAVVPMLAAYTAEHAVSCRSSFRAAIELSVADRTVTLTKSAFAALAAVYAASHICTAVAPSPLASVVRTSTACPSSLTLCTLLYQGAAWLAVLNEPATSAGVLAWPLVAVVVVGTVAVVVPPQAASVNTAATTTAGRNARMW